MEPEVREHARELVVAARTPIEGDEGESAADVAQRAEGEFLRRMVERLQPMLRQSMRSRRIFLASDPHGTVELKSDGVFVHIGIADQEDELAPMEVLRAEPDLFTVLSRIEAELVAANDASATRAAMMVRDMRQSLEVEVGKAQVRQVVVHDRQK